MEALLRASGAAPGGGRPDAWMSGSGAPVAAPPRCFGFRVLDRQKGPRAGCIPQQQTPTMTAAPAAGSTAHGRLVRRRWLCTADCSHAGFTTQAANQAAAGAQMSPKP